MNPDYAFEKLKILFSTINTETINSEADTRVKIIDKILIDSLGWNENNIKREEKNIAGFTDYVLSINDIPYLVVEAKKTGAYFEIPLSYNRRRYKINGAISSVANLTGAIIQARNYCLNIGVRFAAITNGIQFVIFPAFTRGKRWDDAECVIFRDKEDIINHFNIFWNILSLENISDGSLINYLDGRKLSYEFNKIYSNIQNKNQKWTRNRLYTYLRPICEFVFTELLDKAKSSVLKECYIYERSNRNLGTNFKEIFIDKLPHFAANYKIKDFYEREKKAGAFQKEILTAIYNEEPQPLVLLLGGVGVGKSTFIHRFFKIVLEDKETLFWFCLDFRSSSFDDSTIEDFVYHQLLEQFKTLYLPKVDTLLNDVGFNHDENDVVKYIKSLFNLLKKLRFTIILTIDNVDQHDYLFQENLFIFSNHICNDLNILTILAIREETFIQSTQTGVFDAYHIPKFHISSPNFLNMIKKRIEFSISLLKNTDILKRLRLNKKKSIVGELTHYFEIMLRSLSKDNNQSRLIVRFFDNISVGNMREALMMFNCFLISGNTNINEMFQKEKDNLDTFQIGFHQLLKSIMLDEYRFYCSERSHIANLFDFDYSISHSHFNQLRILDILSEKNNAKSKIGRGYILIEEIIQIFESISISKDVVLDCLKRMVVHDLVIFDNQSKTLIKDAYYVKITPAGFLYLNDLIYSFIYLDAVAVDTPISDKETYNEIKKHLNLSDLPNRIYKTKIFIKYLIQSEHIELDNNPSLISNIHIKKTYSESLRNKFNEFVNYITVKASIETKDDYYV
jgi:hypothetical protein